RSTLSARQTCFCGLLRLAATVSSSLRSAALNRMLVRSCILQTRTRESTRECPSESKCQIWSTSPYLMGTEGLNKGPRGLTSYQPIAIDQPFAATMAHDIAAKPGIERDHQAMLNERYDLSDRPVRGVTMERGKPLQEGVRVKLPSGMTWAQLAAMSPDEIRDRGLWPKGFLPLPHPFHPTGGQVFPKMVIDPIKTQDGRDLTRFDIDFDLPEHFLAAFPPEMYLTTRPDLGDVSQGK